MERGKIILVDDVKASLTMGRDLLKAAHEVYPAPSAQRMFELLENVAPDLILLDVEMPEMNGYEAIKRLKADCRYADIPVIFLTSRGEELSEMKGFDLGAADYVTKPFSGPLLLKRIANQLLIARQKKELKDYADNLEEKVKEKTSEVVELQNAVLSTVADLVEFRDENTGGHIARTQRYLQAFVREMISSGIYADEISQWDMGFFLPSAQLHDVGKIAISDLILNKPAKLTPEEFEIMKTHVAIGVDAIKQIMEKTREHKFLDHALLVAGYHHERWDGAGYPYALAGADIPLEGRLMAIADVYDALISARAYKQPMSHGDACAFIESNAGKHFDAVLVEVFKKVKDEFERIVREEREK